MIHIGGSFVALAGILSKMEKEAEEAQKRIAETPPPEVYVGDEHVMRVLGNRLLVRIDKPPERSEGGLFFAHPEAASPHAVGEVLAVGHLTGGRAQDKTIIPGLAVGDRVMFVRLLAITDSNPKLQARLEENVICIRPSDVLLVFAAEDSSRLR